MTCFSELMSGQSLLPIIQANTPEEGVNIAHAMSNAGLNLVEVVLRTEASLEAIVAIKQALPSLNVGAGTVTDTGLLKSALEVGSDFIVTPAVSEKLLAALASCTVPVLPGVSNNGDIMLAKEAGFDELKLFPAELSGGVPFLSAVAAVFPQLRFCPTGGVKPANRRDYLALSNVFAVGGTWVATPAWVQQQDWSAITTACQEALN
ncbi:bifunctional 4-hydroxy-2-oxoglutarate aldolase/2-dehydro-3-deoxy-phosphogluconate aldolase [Planctobacterium marinum]|uniref:2-dehydro-3-deoxy-phosphogluconate aldolase n=1 Tax=Planctobacterium marinum TaxID=1631968 RepID=A0AA48HFJ0_9ALTE|nr:2-dehydro-3-deoxy-phosphogluconate aldolase [Planctobacterium marinum]